MEPLLRPWLSALHPYVPGRPAASEAGGLASNESAFGASPKVADAVAAASGRLHRYPDPTASGLREALAREHGVSPEQVLVGDGSDELIYLLSLAYVAQGGTIVCADPAYRLDEIPTVIVDGRVVGVPLVDWRHDLDAMARVECDIAYVVNPHNPTGTVLDAASIRRFVDASPARLVVIDEAYIHFAPAGSDSMALAREGRAVVLRTFSKAYGLAGARVGYLVGPKDVVNDLRRVRAPFSVGTLPQVAALAALGDAAHLARVVAGTLRMRDGLVATLREAGFEPVPSATNFVLVPTGDADALVTRFLDAGVSVRPGSSLGVPRAVRISVPDEAGLALVRTALRLTP